MSIQNVDTQAEARSVVKAQSEKSNSRADAVGPVRLNLPQSRALTAPAAAYKEMMTTPRILGLDEVQENRFTGVGCQKTGEGYT